MKIFVISLAKAIERSQSMRERISATGLPFHILPATDGATLSATERSFVDEIARRRVSRFPLTDNEVACWHSHRRVMLDLADNGPNLVAVLEDDVLLSADFPRVLDAIETSGIRFDLIDLHRKFREKESFIACRQLCEGFHIGRIRYSQMGAVGYVLSREGARKCLGKFPRFSHAFDKSIKRWWDNDMNYFVLDKPVVTHKDEGSLIGETRGCRASYPEADQINWRVQRFVTKLSDSIRKRMAFPAYVDAAKRDVQPSPMCD